MLGSKGFWQQYQLIHIILCFSNLISVSAGMSWFPTGRLKLKYVDTLNNSPGNIFNELIKIVTFFFPDSSSSDFVCSLFIGYFSVDKMKL